MRWSVFIVTLLICTSCFGANIPGEKSLNSDVLRIARGYKDGGKYNWSGSGTPEAIIFNRETILPVGHGTYCSGFTFAVVMKAAAERGLLAGKKTDQIRKFQQEWYGATKRSAEVQAGYALKRLGIGTSIKIDEARPGDFVQLWRIKDSGHSVVFLEWIIEQGKKVGLRYRSTQESTDGIGDRTEFFSDVAGRAGEVLRKRTYAARLRGK